MALDVDVPDPPDLTNRGLPGEIEPDAAFDSISDLRRGELEDILRDGAWNEAFLEWAEYTYLTDAECLDLQEVGAFDRLDFYWDPFEERLRFEVPPLHGELETQRSHAARITTELEELCQTVIEMLEDGYVDWGNAETAEDVWNEPPFDDEPPPTE